MEAPVSKPRPRRRWPWWVRLPLALATAVVLLMGLLLLLQNKMIFFPERGLPSPAEAGAAFAREVEFTADDGVRLVSWFLPPPEGGPTVVFFHGNAGNLSHRLDRLLFAREAGWGMLLLGYRGYGKSEGEPGEEGLYRDARAARGWLLSQPGVAERRLVFFGESLGCAVALQLASEAPPAALILEAPFASLARMAGHVYPWLPTAWLLRSRFDNLANARKVRSPALVVHGRRDEVVPFPQGQAVFEALAGPKRIVPLDCHHNDIPETGGEGYAETLRAFVKEQVPPP